MVPLLLSQFSTTTTQLSLHCHSDASASTTELMSLRLLSLSYQSANISRRKEVRQEKTTQEKPFIAPTLTTAREAAWESISWFSELEKPF